MSRPQLLPTLSLAAVLERWDALVDHWDLSVAERAVLLGGVAVGEVVDVADVADVASYMPGNAEKRMRLLIEVGVALDLVHNDQRRTRRWLRRLNRRLGGATPIEAMATSTAWMRFLADHVGLAA